MDGTVFLLLLVLRAFSGVQSIYDPHHTAHDIVHYEQNAISDSDENSIVSHGTTCPPNASGQFPYAMDCRQFLNCWEGRGTIQSCAPGTLFNPRSLECDHPSKVKCKSFEEYARPTTASAAYTSQQYVHNGDLNRGQAVNTHGYQQEQHQRVQCPTGASGLFEHPNDCAKFLNCNNGKTVIQDCGPGTAFNSIIKVCDWPQNVDCGSRATNYGEDKIDVRTNFHNDEHQSQRRSDLNGQSTSVIGTDGFGGNYHDRGFNRGQGSYPINGGGGGSVVDINAHSSISNVQNLQYPSYHQIPIVSNAHSNGGAGVSYGDNSQQASQPHVSGSYSTATYASQSANANRESKAALNRVAHSYAGFDAGLTGANQILSTDEEELKTKQKKYQQYPPTQSIYGNNNKPILDELNTAKVDGLFGSSIYIQSAEKIKCKKDVTGIFAHPFDCSKFINCKNGRTDIVDCGPGTMFNSNTRECDWPKNVQCDQQKPEAYFAARKSGRYAVHDDNDEYPESHDDQHPEQEGDSTLTTSGSGFSVGAFDYGASDQHGRRIQCAKNATGLFPHPTDCRKFLHCDNGRTFIQNCGPGTAFNAILEVCDWPQNVDCDVREYDGRRTVEEEDADGGIRKTVVGQQTYGHNTNDEVLPEGTVVEADDGRDLRRYDTSNSYSQIRRHDNIQGGYNYRPIRPIPPIQKEYNSNTPIVECTAEMSGLNEHPYHCDQFLNCDGGYSMVMQCAPHTYFNTITKICDFERNVDCGSRKLSSQANTNVTKFSFSKTAKEVQPNTSSHQLTPNQATQSRQNPAVPNVIFFQQPGIIYAPSSTPSPSLIRPSKPIAFNFSDQNVGNIKNDSPTYNKQWGTNKTPHDTFIIPDMSKIPLEEFPGAKYPVAPLNNNNNNNSSNKRVSQGGDVQTDGDLQTAAIWPFRRESHNPIYGANMNNSDTPSVYRPAVNRTQPNYSASRDHITPIYFRATTTPPPVPHPTHDANYNKAYYKPTTGKPLNPDIQTDYLPISEALKLLMRPYLNKNDTPTVNHIHHKTMEEKILNMAEKTKNYKTDHTVSLEQDSLASADFDQVTIKHPEPDSDDEMPPEIPLIPSTVPSTVPHDQNCRHYHPPSFNKHHPQPNHKFPPNFVHSPEFHKTYDRKHWTDTTNTKTFTDNTNDENKPISGTNFHHNPHFHHNPNFHHHHRHDHQHHHSPPHDHNQQYGPGHPNFQHDPNHPYHRNHPIRSNGMPRDSTASDTTGIQIPNINLRFGSDYTTTEPTRFIRINGADTTDVESLQTCNEFDCQNGLCVPFSKVCDGRNDCRNRLDEQTCDHVGYEVRLTDDRGRKNMGRIEVKAFDKWGYVCDDKFGIVDANVLCRELGFTLGAAEVKSNSYYTPHESTIEGAAIVFNMDEVNCLGNETSLKECDFSGWGVSDCNAEEVVGVICKVPVMKCPPNYWLCETSEECIPMSFMCDNVRDCSDGTDEAPQHCNATLEYRLVGGANAMEGRVEVKFQDVWGTVCDDDFGESEAFVFCKSLGFTGLASVMKGNHGKATGPIWLDQVSCNGNETALDKCMHFEWGETNCNHAEDVSVKCSNYDPSNGRNQHKFGNPSDDIAAISSDTQQYLYELQRNSKSVPDYSSVCGQVKVSPDLDEFNEPGEFRVISGTRTKRGLNPWQATIRAKGRNGKSSHWCGAVVISKFHILTAAHCLIGFPKGAYLIRLGDHHAEIVEDSEIEVFIDNWIIHEDFRKGQHMNNDIAVILLKSPIQFTNYIQPVCLPSRDTYYEPGRNCTISGWGSIQYGKSTPSLDLKAGIVPIIDQNICKKNDIYGDAIMDGMFCAGYLGEEGPDACDGDSGGPLVCAQDNGVNTLYGIISWGQRCGDSNKPGVYVRVTEYLDWIRQKVNLLTSSRNSR